MLPRRSLVAYQVIACIALALTVPASGAFAEDKRFTQFMEAFERLDLSLARRADWVGTQSPFAPYIEPSFLDGLSERSRKVYRRAHESGACFLAEEIAIVGFLVNHPHLTPAFQRSDVRMAFAYFVWPSQSPCCARALRSLAACCALCMPRGEGDKPDPTLRQEFAPNEPSGDEVK